MDQTSISVTVAAGVNILPSNEKDAKEPSPLPKILSMKLESPTASGTYENVSDVEYLTTDSEGESGEEKEIGNDEIQTTATSTKFLSSIYFGPGPSEVKHFETKCGVLKAVTSSISKDVEEAHISNMEDHDSDFLQTDCEDCEGSGSDTDSIVISDSGLEKYMESATFGVILETAESCKQIRRVSEISDTDDGDWMNMEDIQKREGATKTQD